jgi:hypothetical protein
MSGMGEMPMPGGWTMSMAWMRMPGQTWPGAAASFLGMWVVMMVAMMLPSLVPMLWRYRQAVGSAGEPRLAGLTALAGPGLLLRVDRAGNGRVSAGRRAGGGRDAAAGAGARRSPHGRRGRPDRRRAPVHRVEGALPCLLPGGARPRTHAAGRRRHRLATGPASGSPLQLRLRQSDGACPGHRGHGPSRDGGRGGRHHRRTPRSGWRARRASHRGHRRRGRAASDRKRAGLG